MRDNNYQEVVEQVIEDTSYLALATTDGSEPWLAPIEYFRGDTENFYFFSTTDSRHATHIEANETVAVALWSQEQPEYEPGMEATLNGVQIRATAKQLYEEEYPPVVEAAIDELDTPMPPYAPFEIEPQRMYVPILEDGINKRVEVDLE